MHVIYIQNAKQIAKQFYIQKIDTLQKERQFTSRFVYKKPDTLQYANCLTFCEVSGFFYKNVT